jgi:single-strand DNA-binding protein
MINDAQVFLSGYVAKEPKYRITSSGHAAVTLRVGYTPRRVDRESGEWMDGATSFVTVVCWRTLAQNVATCLRKGEPVLVRGRLQVRPYEKDGQARLAVEIEASSVGHDLARGVANFQRARRSPGETAFGRAGQPVGNGLADGNGLGGNGLGGNGLADGNGLGGNALGGPARAETPAGAAGNSEFFAEDAVAALAAGDGPERGGDGNPDGASMDRPDPVRDGATPDGPEGAAEPAAVSAPF